MARRSDRDDRARPCSLRLDIECFPDTVWVLYDRREDTYNAARMDEGTLLTVFSTSGLASLYIVALGTQGAGLRPYGIRFDKARREARRKRVAGLVLLDKVATPRVHLVPVE